MTAPNDSYHKQNGARPMHVAVVALMLGIFVLTLAASWLEARWPNAAGDYITVIPQGAADAASILWRLRRVSGVHDAFAVLRGSLSLGETLDTGWTDLWLQANYTDAPSLAFVPPDPALELWQGQLPQPDSVDEAVLSYELAQNLHLSLGDSLPLQNRSFAIVGIWSPSARAPGNWAQVSLATAQVMRLFIPDHFVVLPADKREVARLARRIWQEMPDVAVLSPEWETARAHRERTGLATVAGAALLFVLLLAVPAWASDATGRRGPALLAALLSGAGGLAVGWAAAALANLYAQSTLALTPFRVTPRLGIAVLAMATLVWGLATLLPFRRSWPLRCAATALLLVLCAAALAAFGALTDSLHLSLSEAQRAAADWVTLSGLEADQRLLQNLNLIPGIRGYVIEAAGGLANEDEQRWVGPMPPSGVVFGASVVGGEGTLSLPFCLGYWRGGPLDPQNTNEVVVGYDLAQAKALTIGDMVDIRGIPFTVVGIRQRLPYDPSNEANYRLDISLYDLRRVLQQPSASGEITVLIPPAEDQDDKAIFLEQMATRLGVTRLLTVDGRLAQIARSYPGTWTLTPASASEAVRHARVIYTSALWACTIFLLLACALSISGTMKDRLARDEQHITLRKVLGSSEGVLLGEYLQMAAVLGATGGLLGTLAGWALTILANRLAPYPSPELILAPPRAAAVFFVTAITAMLAAVAPTLDAVRQNAISPLYSSAQVVQGGSRS